MIVPILLCGGSGTRLWPLSRRSYPKQFVSLIGDLTLFQASALRLSGEGYGTPTVVTGSDFRFIVSEQLDAVGLGDGRVLIEPEGRNTAPAILAAALRQAKDDASALMLVAPSDHIIPDADEFRDTIQKGVAAAEAGQIVTFGITPDRPETGYGYLEVGETGPGGASTLARFVEKPEADRAREMLADGSFLWNAGIFLFSAKTIIDAYQTFVPEMVEHVQHAVDGLEVDLGFERLAAKPWSKADDISIDYAIMERSDALSVVPFTGRWSDLGGWDAVAREGAPDTQNTVTSGAATSIDCADSLLRSESESLEVVGIGLTDTIVVAMPDAVLVADKSRAQDVKLAVSKLKEKGARQAVEFPKDHRPWGWFETLVLGGRFQVKRIHVHPGAALSLQSHHHRSEHWIVVEGTAKVTVDDEVRLVTENQSVYIPLGAVHRMENPGKVPMVLIEVQTGIYLGEDDIIRYEDTFGRR